MKSLTPADLDKIIFEWYWEIKQATQDLKLEYSPTGHWLTQITDT